MILPACADEVAYYYKNNLDILLLTGDAYVDHPSFGISIIAQLLKKQGYRVAIAAQPTKTVLKKYPRPNLLVGITAGNVDSILSNYTANRKIRSDDKYSSWGSPGFKNKRNRPPRATIVYANWIKEIFKGIPVVIGGIEASLRRFVHYDYYSDKIRKSILADSKADLLVYGMGESQILEIVKRVEQQGPDFDRTGIPGTCYLQSSPQGKILPSYEEVVNNKSGLPQAYKLISQNIQPGYSSILSQQQDSRHVICNPPALPVDTVKLDEIYGLPYSRTVHPLFKEVPAFQMIANSITSHRGCAGNCSFCSIITHQGRIISSRSESSILQEVDIITTLESFHGHITDVGGPSADMYGSYCNFNSQIGCGYSRFCLYPKPCPNFVNQPDKYFQLLEKILNHPLVKKVSIGSGLRLDLALSHDQYLKKIITTYTSGILKVAPEHIAPQVLEVMRKYQPGEFEKFHKRFTRLKKEFNLRVQLVPYFILSHPGETESDLELLSRFVKKNRIFSKAIQDFTPSPLTRSTVIYARGINPDSGQEIYVAKKDKIRKRRRTKILNKKP